ncbi:MAG TPA: hypothetical protein VK203_27035 [Nostocaceae cyanobacterium]|nr:hypothetical protein [Nostocaceae cyanobacterium]
MAQKIIYGTVSEDGTIISGQEFAVETTEPGIYIITFAQAFASPPCVVATLKNWGADNQIVVDNDERDKCQIKIWDLEVTQTSGSTGSKLEVRKENSAFNFIAIGEES